MKEKLRSEIEDKYKWDLAVIYSSDEEWQKDYEEVKSLLPCIEKYKGHLMDVAKT